MIKLTHIVTVTAVLAIGLSGVASARDGDRTERGNKQRPDLERSARNRNQDTPADRSLRSRSSREQDVAARGAGGNRVDRRQDNQRARIRDGRESGALTRWESKKLRKDQKKISRMERRFARDGHINKQERRILNKAQDRASHRIYRFKHNDSRRGWGSRRDYGHSRNMRPGWGHGRHSYIVVNPVVEQVAAYAPSSSESLALNLQFDGGQYWLEQDQAVLSKRDC